MVQYDNEQAVTAEIQAFQAENNKLVDDYINRMLTNIGAIYNKYGITIQTPFSELQRKISSVDARQLNNDLRELSRLIDDEDLKRELKPIASMTVYDSIGANIALGIGSLFYVISKNLTKQIEQSERSEAQRLKTAYKVNKDYHTKLYDSFKPFLANHYIKEVYNYRSQFRSDLLAQRTMEHTVDKLQKRALVLKGRNKYTLINEMTSKQLDAQIWYIVKSGFPKYEILQEANACHICKPFNHKSYTVDQYEPSVTAPKWHPNCRCTIIGAN